MNPISSVRLEVLEWKAAPEEGTAEEMQSPGGFTIREEELYVLQFKLVPLIGFISVGLGSAVLYLLRLALYSPDIRYGAGGVTVL
ncbi:NADH dehydrogenase [ubiquinone] 1 alpha subcomplex subunit 4-like 2 isoform X3 [Tympanuchus pallidicinctus]|uniref:NADH dehydrogenase [ubiquinone] 1 alpha subcomplex subunit 4-like 2 isoform X3 n=1 Tax=Tympanuchus pallidicinctus TaxID=109042 RepID=UPI002286EDA0|nr:NADH dehydrogenase [ubiquinone] 1 alpha subcomplex subunit 4-like 2 isoform X3 [Tympanuchus pallidicinctus]